MFHSDKILNHFTALKEILARNYHRQILNKKKENAPLEETVYITQVKADIILSKINVLALYLNRIDLIKDYNRELYVENLLKQKKPDSIEALDKLYQHSLDELFKDFMETFEIYLSTQSIYYLNEKAIHLNQSSKQEILLKHHDFLEEIFNSYKAYTFSQYNPKQLNTVLENLQNDLEVIIDSIQELHQQQDEVKTQLANDVTHYEANYDELKNLEKDVYSEINNELSEIAKQGNLKKVIDFLNATKAKKEKLDELGTNGLTPLHNACLYGHVDIVKCLLERGANVKIKSAEGYLAIHYAVQHHKSAQMESIIDLLLKHKAKVDDEGIYGRTAMHTAAFFGHYDAIIKLLNLGANPNARETGDSPGQTPLHNAAQENHANIVALLLQRNYVYPFTTNNSSETALVVALLYGSKESAEVIIDLGYTLRKQDIAFLNAYTIQSENNAALVKNAFHLYQQINIERMPEKFRLSVVGKNKKRSEEKETWYEAISPKKEDEDHYSVMPVVAKDNRKSRKSQWSQLFKVNEFTDISLDNASKENDKEESKETDYSAARTRNK